MENGVERVKFILGQYVKTNTTDATPERDNQFNGRVGILRREWLNDIDSWLLALPEEFKDYGDILRLVYIEGQSVEALADDLGVDVEDVEGIIDDACAKLDEMGFMTDKDPWFDADEMTGGHYLVKKIDALRQ